MAYIVVKTIKGRQYRYLQRSWREGGKVRTESKCLGPLAPLRLLRKIGEFIKAQGPLYSSLPDEETELLKQQDRKNATRQTKLRELHDLYGLRISGTPPATVAGDQKKAPSVEGAEGVSIPTPALL